MKIFSKKLLCFRNRATGELYKTPLLSFSIAPDWIQSDPLYDWAVSEETLQVFPDSVAEETKTTKKAKAKAEAGE